MNHNKASHPPGQGQLCGQAKFPFLGAAFYFCFPLCGGIPSDLLTLFTLQCGVV